MRDRHVALDAERVLVVFDAAKRRQELVIWPGFSGDTADFGYVVPLPSAPTVAAAEEGLFEALDRAIEPEVRHESVTEWEVGWFFGPPGDGAEMMAGAKGGVEVLMHGRVGAFEVAVLRADDPAALTQWLNAHSYVFDDAATKWAARYVEAKFVFAALRIRTGDEDAGAAQIHPVRFGFETDRAFLPFGSPAPAEQTVFKRLYLLTRDHVRGRAGERVWLDRAALEFAAPVDTAPFASWLPDAGLLKTMTLTVADIEKQPGEHHTEDMWLEPARSTDEVRPPPEVITTASTIFIPLEGVVLLLGVLAVVYWRRRRAS